MKINLSVKQQRYVMTRSKIRRVILTRNQSIILLRERSRKFQLTIGGNDLMNSG